MIAVCTVALLAGVVKHDSQAQSESKGTSVQAGVRDKARLVPKQEQSGEQRITDQAYRPRAARRLVQMQRIEKDKVEDAEAADGADGTDAADEDTFAPSRGGGNKERRLLFGF